MNKKIIAFGLACVFAVSMVAPSAGAVTDEQYQALVDQLADLTALYTALLAQTTGGTTPAATAVCFNTDLQQGMTSDSVKDLQIKLGVTPTSGYFGPITLAAVKTFQTSNGIINTGYVGPLTRGALNALYCTPVTPVTTYPAGCTSAVGYSPTTGLSCSGTTTTTVAAPSYGSLSVVSYPVSNPQTTLYGGATYEVVAAQYKATGSDITIRKIPVRFLSVAATVFPWQAFTSVSIWDGSTQLVSVPITQANLIETTFAQDYTLDISGLNIVIPNTAKKILTVKVDAITNAVSAVTGTTFTVTILGTGVVNMDTAGVTYTTVSGGDVVSATLTLSASQAATITTTLATDNPLAGNIIGSKTATTKADLLKFNVKVENVNATFNSGTITATSTAADVTSLELWDSGTLITSAAPNAAGAVAWSNFTLPISAGTTKTLTVKANLIQYASTYAGGDMVNVSVGPVLTGIDANSNVVTANGDTTAVGATQYVYIEAPVFTYVSSSATVKGTGTNNLSDIGDTAITFSVTANGGDIYIPTVGNLTNVLGVDELLTGGSSAVAAIGDITFSGTASTTGTATTTINSANVHYVYDNAATSTTVAIGMAAAINAASTTLGVTATSDGEVVSLMAVTAGFAGNSITYNATTTADTGITATPVTATDLTGGLNTQSTSTTWTCSSPSASVADAAADASYLWKIPSGSTANCTFSALVTNTNATVGYFSVALEHAKWSITAASTTASYINQSWGFTNIKTADFYLGK